MLTEKAGLDVISVGRLTSFFDFEENGCIKYPVLLMMMENNQYIADFMEEYYKKEDFNK